MTDYYMHICICFFQLKGIKRAGYYRLYEEGRDIDTELEALKEKTAKKKAKPAKEVRITIKPIFSFSIFSPICSFSIWCPRKSNIDP